METMQEQKQKNCKALILKLFLFVIAGSQIFMGHFYSAMVILGSASILHIEVLSLGYVLRKDTAPKMFTWLDLYWYAVGAYITVPWFFFRRRYSAV